MAMNDEEIRAEVKKLMESTEEIIETLGMYFDHFYNDIHTSDRNHGQVTIAAAILAVGAALLDDRRRQ